MYLGFLGPLRLERPSLLHEKAMRVHANPTRNNMYDPCTYERTHLPAARLPDEKYSFIIVIITVMS